MLATASKPFFDRAQKSRNQRWPTGTVVNSDSDESEDRSTDCNDDLCTVVSGARRPVMTDEPTPEQVGGAWTYAKSVGIQFIEDKEELFETAFRLGWKHYGAPSAQAQLSNQKVISVRSQMLSRPEFPVDHGYRSNPD